MQTMLPDGTSITTFPDLTIDAPGSDGYKRWTDRMTEAQIIESEFELLDGQAGHFGGVSPDLVLPPSVMWAGGIVHPPTDDKIISVEATWTIPDDAGVPNAPDIYGRAIWFTSGIGIDNHSSSGGMLYAYVGNWIEVDKDGNATRTFASGPWFLWGRSTYSAPHFPNPNPGDTVSCYVQSPWNTSLATANALIGFHNVTQNKAMPVFINNPPTGGVLAGAQAEWIVAASYGARGQVVSGAPDAPIPTFGRVDFTDCTATTQSGQQLTSGSGDSLNMVYQNAPNDTPVCATTLNGSSEIWVDYTGDR